MNSGGRIPPALQSKVEDYWSKYQEAHKGIDIKPFEHQMGLFLKGLKQAPDGRYIAHVDTHINLHSAELQADPRIKWVNDKGEEVKLPGVDVEEPSSFVEAEPPLPPPAPGAEAMKAGAKRFAALDETFFSAKPKLAVIGMEEGMLDEVTQVLEAEKASGPSIKALGGVEHQFEIDKVLYQPLVQMRSPEAAKAMAQRLTEDFGSASGGDFGVVSKGKTIYIMSPANMKDLKAVANDKGELPNGMKIE